MRCRYLLLSRQLLAEINQALGLNIRKSAVNKVRFRLCKAIPALRPRNPPHQTNHILRRVAIKVIEQRADLIPADKKWAMQEIIFLAKRLLIKGYYPGCPEAHGYALALLVVNCLHRRKNLPRCRIPSSDEKFRKQVSMAIYRLKKQLPLN